MAGFYGLYWMLGIQGIQVESPVRGKNVSTIHANSAEGTFLRMKTLLKQAFGIEQPVNNLVDMIIHLSKSPKSGIEVDEVIDTLDYSEDQIEEIAKRSIEKD